MKFKKIAKRKGLYEANDDIGLAMERSEAYKKFWDVWDRFTEFCNDVGFRWNDQHDVSPLAVLEVSGDGKMVVWNNEEPRMPYDRYVISAGAFKPNGDVDLSCISDVDEYRQRLENRPSGNIEKKLEEYSEFYEIMCDWHNVFTKAKFLKVSGDEADDFLYA